MNNSFTDIGYLIRKPVMLLLLIAGLIPYNLYAQFLVINDARITVTANSEITLKAGLHNISNGRITNSGNINILGNLINDGIYSDFLSGDNGSVIFKGETGQEITGTSPTKFDNIFIQNDVLLKNSITVSGELGLSSGKVVLDTNYLTLETGAVITGVSDTEYIVAGSSGQLKREVGAVDVEFPVGTDNSFTPVVLSNSGDVDVFGVNVFNDVLENGLTGNTIYEINNCVNNTWNVTETVVGGSEVTLTVFWDASLEGSAFDRGHCGIGHFTGGAWQPQTEGQATGSNPYSVSRTGITSLSAFAVGDTVSPMSVILRLKTDLTVLLEGPFNGVDMNTKLNDLNLIPLQQPYFEAPWNYSGTESVQEIPDNVVDWILVELRDAPDSSSATSATKISRRAAFILNDGSIVDLDGVSNLEFDNSISQKLFVVIWHRNHLGIMSANNLVESDGVYSYNFTTGDSQVYGDDGQKEVGTGVYGMYSGDSNSDNIVDSLDINLWKQEAGETGYNKTDFNLDGQIDNNDKDDIWIENKNVTSKVPQ